MHAGEDRLTVTVAGTPTGPTFSYRGEEPAPGATWAQLPKATIVADPSDTLRVVLGHAADALGVVVPPEIRRIHANIREQEGKPAAREEGVTDGLFYAAFRRPDDDEPPEVPEGTLRRDARSRKRTVVVVRDSAGRAVWRRPPLDATIGELLDAREVGLLDEDPLQAYLVLTIPQGSIGVLGEWQQFQQGLEAAWHLRGLVAEAITYVSFIGWVRNWAKRRSGVAAQVVEKNSPDWAKRGAAPPDLLNLLAAKPRDTGEIAALLGCSAAEAEAILWSLGFTPEKAGGPWIHRGGALTRIMQYREAAGKRLRRLGRRRRPPVS